VEKVSASKSTDIRMLPRDWELLSFLEEQGFASGIQIRDQFFNGKRSSCSTRLSKLLSNGYIHRKKLLEIFRSGKKGSRKLKFFPHILNLNIRSGDYIYYIDRRYALGFGKSGQLFKPSMVLHQLVLNEVRFFLEEEVIHKRVLNDPKAKILSKLHLGTGSDTVPDLSFEYNHIKIAVELERTLKSNLRYFQRFSALRQSKYTHVLYYYVDERHLLRLLKHAGAEPSIAFAHYKTPNEVFSNVFGMTDVNTFLHKSLES